MRLLPEARSWKCAWISAILATILFLIILISTALMHAGAPNGVTVGLAVLPVAAALIAAAGGWLGGRLFFVCTALGSLLGAGYMLYLGITGAASGWEDLAGIAGFLTLAAGGFLAGLLAELVRPLIKRIKNKTTK